MCHKNRVPLDSRPAVDAFGAVDAIDPADDHVYATDDPVRHYWCFASFTGP